MQSLEPAVLVWTAIGFVAGSIPFSPWLGKLFLREDVRQYGDRNPGATNAWRAGGWRLGMVVLLLDILKGLLPVGLAVFRVGIAGWGLVPVALAPVLGHAFSPFLQFRGGKAVAVSFGVWTGLLLGGVPIVLPLLLTAFYAIQSSDAWAVMLTLVGFLAYLLLRGVDAVLLAIWGGDALILLWKHREGLQEPIRARKWLLRFLRRKS
jgi:glycerol-3-phosphate acyltransferase PlsY